MILAQLELNEATEMDFGIEVHGTTESTSEIRFIIEGPTYGIICKCVENAGTITASIPKLKGILPAGTFNAKLEVVVDGKFFIPLSESIEFKPMVEFDVTSTKAKPADVRIETTAIKVRVLEDDKTTAEPDTEDDAEAEEDDSTEAEQNDAAPAPAAEPKPAAPKEDKPQGTKPEATWQEVVKASVTRPEKAPKAEVDPFYTKTPKVGSFVPASASKTATTTPDTAVAAPKASAPAAKEGQPPRKAIDKNRAQELSSKLAEYKNKLADLKGKK